LQSALAGAGLVFRIPLLAEENAAAPKKPFIPNQWLRIGADGRTTLVIARSEMGQGVRTSLAMILAEELEVDWDSVLIEQASPGPEFEDMNTGGSDSVESSWMPLRRAGAAAREALTAAAARTWKVEPGTCRAENGTIVHTPTGRRLTYGRLVGLPSPFPVPNDPPPQDPKNFRLVGTRVRRVDGPAIVAGRARYGLDVRVPDMLFAAIARCPVRGGKLRSFNAARAKAISGVHRVVPIGAGVAVVAADSWSALR